MLSLMISNNVWTRIKRERGLYRYNPSGQYFARVRFRGKLYRRKLGYDDLALAKRKLRDFKNDLERTDATRATPALKKCWMLTRPPLPALIQQKRKSWP